MALRVRQPALALRYAQRAVVHLRHVRPVLKRPWPRWLAVACCTGVLAGCLASCGGSSSTRPTAPVPAARTSATRASGALRSSSPVASAPRASSPKRATATTATTATTALEQDVPYDQNGVATYAVGPQPGNWDIHAAGSLPWRSSLEQILAQVWPSAFYLTPQGTPVLNTSLLSSAAEVASNPQVVVYKINPQAVWSDGVPITYKDFVYNWQAQSGKGQFKDKSGRPFRPMSTVGYDQIASVSGSPADPYTVTVTFSSPYPDWESLFAYLMPAHVAQAVGFDHGFTDPVADLVSGGPFLVAQLQPGYSLELVRNASYWGQPANLATVTYYFVHSLTEAQDALGAGELDVATLLAQPAEYKALQASGGLSVQVVPTSWYEDLDFNERSLPFSKPAAREAVMVAIDRSAMVSDVLGPYGVSVPPVQDRAYLPGSPGYVLGGAQYDQADQAEAMSLMESAGYTMSAKTLYAPDGLPLVVNLSVPRGDPVAQELAQEVVSACASIGMRVNLAEVGPSLEGLLPGPAPKPWAGWQMAIDLREVPAFPGSLAERYGTGGAANVDGYSSSAMDALLARAAAATGAERLALYGDVDSLAWADFVDLPLVALPVMVVTSPHLLNVHTGPYFGQLAWDEQDWGFEAP
ncbi:MAG: ABC transporter family substrate-binding protein [Acidimicrobiales bacterium]